MSSVDVVVVAKKGTPYCASCGGGRTLEEVTLSMAKQLKQRFGGAVTCRFVDVSEFRHEGASAEISRNTKFPVVLIGGKVRYRGLFSPTFIRRDVKELLERQAASNGGVGEREIGARARAAHERQALERGTRQWSVYSTGGWGTSALSSNSALRSRDRGRNR